MDNNGLFEDLIDSINNIAKEKGFINGLGWANDALKKNYISFTEFKRYENFHYLRNRLSHGGARDISISKETLKEVKEFKNKIGKFTNKKNINNNTHKNNKRNEANNKNEGKTYNYEKTTNPLVVIYVHDDTNIGYLSDFYQNQYGQYKYKLINFASAKTFPTADSADALANKMKSCIDYDYIDAIVYSAGSRNYIFYSIYIQCDNYSGYFKFAYRTQYDTLKWSLCENIDDAIVVPSLNAAKTLIKWIKNNFDTNYIEAIKVNCFVNTK